MNKKSERQEKLLQIIKLRGMLPIKTLAGMLDVSIMTIHRDFEELNCESGPADSVQDQTADSSYSLLIAVQRAYEQKDRIGKFAASLIERRDVVIIDTGSTTSRILPYIPNGYDLTVVCYNANVLQELRNRRDLQLFMCGGVYHENTEMFESPEGVQFIERIRANKVFLSAAGVHAQLGVTCANAHEVPTKKAVIKSSEKKILVADSGKFGQVRSSYFCTLDNIDTIVTDTNLPDEWRRIIQASNIMLHLV